MPVKPDPNILYPLVCLVAGVDLGDLNDPRLPKRGGVTLEDVPAEEVQDFSDRNSLSIEPPTSSVSTGVTTGSEAPLDPSCVGLEPVKAGTTHETSVQTDADGNVTTTESTKTTNPDGTTTSTTKTSTTTQGGTTSTNTHKELEGLMVKTTTTTTKPDGTTSTQISYEPYTPPQPASVLLRINLDNGAEFALIRPLTKLRVGGTCTVIENYTDRHALRVWQNAIVHSPPKWQFMQHAQGSEFYSLNLEFLIVGGAP